ncbi:MAG: hypothetical protein ABIJ48_11105 [Actinomycetota bacterium]
MKPGQKRWIPVLVALLVAVLLSTGGGEMAVAAADPRVTVGTIMIPAVAFVPTSDNWSYTNYGHFLWANSSSSFIAPLSFPVPGVSVGRITLHAATPTCCRASTSA